MSHALARGAAALFAVVSLCLAGCGDAGAEQDVRDAFDAFITAEHNKNADAMLDLIDPENIKHDDYLVEMARAGTKVQLMRLTSYDRFQVTVLRGLFKADELNKLDGRKLFKLSVEQDWEAMGEADEEITLGKVQIKKPRASGELVVDGEATGLKLELVQVNEKWLLNNDSFDRISDRLIQRLAAMGHTTDDDIIIRLASRVCGREQHKAIWDEPPK
jgi:hypothetical protein